MNRNILLTFETDAGYNTFGWFESIDEINDFIATSEGVVALIDCIDCSNCIQIELSELGN